MASGTLSHDTVCVYVVRLTDFGVFFHFLLAQFKIGSDTQHILKVKSAMLSNKLSSNSANNFLKYPAE